jgi:type IV pilus assembly protein PilC
MNSYQYEAWDSDGGRRVGTKEANDQGEILSWLRDEECTPVSVDVVAGISKKEKKVRAIPYKKVKSIDLSGFCWQLGTMLGGGITITTAMETIAEDQENKYFAHALEKIAAGLQQGETLSDGIGQYPKIFNTIARAMISAGEASGTVVKCLLRMSEYYDSKDKLVRKIKSAVTYPCFVVGFIIVIVVTLMTFIIPSFTGIFEDMGSDLPAFTKAFMAVYNAIMDHFVLGAFLSVSVVVSVWLYSRTKKGHKNLSILIYKVPLLGQILSQGFVAIFFRTLATLLEAGVSILDAFAILSKMTNNDVAKEAILGTRERIVEGGGISASMIIADFFPTVAIKMTQVGEESGSLPEVMEKTSEYYERKVDTLLTRLLGMLEPILIITVGAIVLVVVLAMYLPIFSLSDVKA